MASWKKDSSGNWKKSESSKKNYTIVNGQKVEKTTATASAPSTSSDTWNKDTVTLEEAAQQTKDVESGVINVDTGSTSIEAPATTETISLEQAATQTQTESANRVLASEAAQNPTDVTGTVTTSTEYNPNTGEFTKTTVTDTETTYNNLSTIKAGSSIKSAAQLDPITIKKTEAQTKTTNLKDTALGQLNAYRINYDELKQEETTTSIRVLTAEENASLRKDILGDQTLTAEDTLSSSTSLKSRELANAYEQQDTDLYNASRLGGLEPVASKYESVVSSLINAEAKALDKVNVLDKVTGKSINQPFADFVLSAGEALALTPVSTARMAVSAVRDPLGTARASVEQPVKAIIENPAKGLGSLAGSIVGGVALAKVAGVGGQAAAKAGKSASLEVKSSIFKAAKQEKTPTSGFKSVGSTASEVVDLRAVEVPDPVQSNYISMKKATASKVVDLRAVEAPDPVQSNYISMKKATASEVVDLKAVEVPDPVQSNYISMKKASASKVVDLEAVMKFNEEKTATWLTEEQALTKSGSLKTKSDVFEYGERIRREQALDKLLNDDSGSTYLSEIGKKRAPVKELVLEKPRMSQSEFNKLLSEAPSKRGKRVKFRTNQDLMTKAKRNVAKRKAARSEKASSISSIPAIGIKSKQVSSQTIGQAPIQSIKQDVLQIQKQTIKQTQRQTPKQKLKQSVAQATAQQQTTSQQQEPSIKDPVKPPREPIKTPSGVPRMPRLKVIPPAEITPRKARHSKKKGKKSKVEIDTIKNTYIDPMKALGRRKL